MEEKRAHAMLFPFPSSGQINPMLKLAELLHSRGVHVTFVNTENSHEQLRRPQDSDGFRFESVPDGLDDADRVAHDKKVMRKTCTAPLVELARRVGAREGVPPVTCVVINMIIALRFKIGRR